MFDVSITLQTSTHMCADGLCQGPVPVIDNTVDLRLDQQLCALTGFHLREGEMLQVKTGASSHDESALGQLFVPVPR